MGNAVALRYELKLEDLVEFNKFHLRTSLKSWILPAVIVCLMIVYFIVKRDWSNLESLNLFVSLIILYIIFVVLTKGPLRNWLIKIRVKRCYGNGAHPGLVGPHKMTVSDRGILEESNVGEHRVNWDGIIKVETSDTHTFIYIGAIHAHVIPRASVMEGNYDTFVAQAKEWSQQKSPAQNA